MGVEKGVNNMRSMISVKQILKYNCVTTKTKLWIVAISFSICNLHVKSLIPLLFLHNYLLDVLKVQTNLIFVVFIFQRWCGSLSEFSRKKKWGGFGSVCQF